MARIIRSATDFSHRNRPLPGFPILVTDNMALIEPACLWLLHQATIPGRSGSPDTLKAHAEDLVDWLDTIEQSGWTIEAVTDEHLAAYRNRMLSEPSQRTWRPYSRRTINKRVCTIIRFHKGYVSQPC